MGWNVGGQIALGYAFAGIVLLGFAFVTRGRTTAASVDEAPAPEKAVEERDEPATVAPIDRTRPATA